MTIRSTFLTVSFALIASEVSAQTIQKLTLCIPDLSMPSGFRMQEATLVDGRDTVVNVNGTNRPLAETLDSFPVARASDWYIKGTPLVTGSGRYGLRLFNYGSAQSLTSDYLNVFGYISGTPLYAKRSEVEAILKDLAAIYRSRPRRELGDILAENPNLRVHLDKIRVFYVPISHVGCMFQGVMRDEDMRN